MNQIPNIEEAIKKIARDIVQVVVDNWPEYNLMTGRERNNLFDGIKPILHHQLQKARQDWLREEIVRLKEIQSNIDDFDYDSDERGKREILQTIIDRYQDELDQDNK